MSQRPDWWRVALAVSFALAACAPQQGDWYFGSDAPIEVISAGPEDHIQLRSTASTLIFDPANGISDIGPITTGSTGAIFLTTRKSCKVFALSPEDGTVFWSAGGCGEGPGEFRHIAALVVVADSILVFDTALRRRTVLRTDGTYLSANGFDELGNIPLLISAFLLHGRIEYSAPVLQDRVYNGRPVPSLLSDTGVASLRHPKAFQSIPVAYELGYPACATGDSVWPIAVLNSWRSELAIIGRSRVRSIRLPNTLVHERQTRRGTAGDFVPNAVGTGLACGTGVVAVSYVLPDSTAQVAATAHHVVVALDGGIVAQLRSTDPILLGTVITVERNRIRIRNNQDLAHPRIVALEWM